MSDTVTIRRAAPADFAVLGEIMFDAVHNAPSRYTPQQRQAWVPEPRRGDDWNARLAGQVIFIAEQDGHAAGFMSLAPPDYVDFAYIRPGFQGSGLFRRLYTAIEEVALEEGQTRLTVHASLMAQPAFSAMGFQVTQRETVEVRGEQLDRFAMEKPLKR
ncbi:MAG: GNAT family N-acetyltransferase [Pseudomonadota bacterium]|nr:GNAT family N-acetyltransferase [Pseudomonadota bacterium]